MVLARPAACNLECRHARNNARRRVVAIEMVIPGDANASPLKKVIRLVLVLLAIGAGIALLV